jgi:hypothetical protein
MTADDIARIKSQLQDGIITVTKAALELRNLGYSSPLALGMVASWRREGEPLLYELLLWRGKDDWSWGYPDGGPFLTDEFLCAFIATNIDRLNALWERVSVPADLDCTPRLHMWWSSEKPVADVGDHWSPWSGMKDEELPVPADVEHRARPPEPKTKAERVAWLEAELEEAKIAAELEEAREELASFDMEQGHD